MKRGLFHRQLMQDLSKHDPIQKIDLIHENL